MSADGEKIPVAIVDDEAEARMVLRDIVNESDVLECVASFASGEAALEGISLVKPRVVLMDVRMPGMSGVECARQLKAMLPQLVVVFVSGMLDFSIFSEGFEAGGDCCLAKPFVAAQCLFTILFALRRARSPEVHSRPCGGSPSAARLSEREISVMEALSKGYLYKEIEDRLGLSNSVLKKIQHGLFAKLHVNNRSEAIIRWMK